MTRKEILEKLAAGAMTREDAETQLAALGSPVPQELPLPPEGPQKGMSKGCLIALLATIIFIALMMFVLPFLFIATKRVSYSSSHEHQMTQPHISHTVEESIRQEAIKQGFGSDVKIEFSPAEKSLPAEAEENR